MVQHRHWLPAIILAASCTVPVIAVGPARALDLPPLHSERPPFFSADVAISLDHGQHPALSVSITLPYSELEWILLDPHQPRLAAGVEFTVVFEARGKTEVPGDAWERRAVVADYRASRRPNAVFLEKRTIAVPPGSYHARITARDLNSGQESIATEKIEVPDYSRVPVGFADLELGLADSTGRFEPVPTRRFGTDVVRVAARAALFDRRAGTWPRHYTLQYHVRDEDGQMLLTGSQEATVASSGDSLLIRPTRGDLFLGAYTFEVELVEGRSHWRVERSFEVDESGPPRGKEFERILEALAYIATPEEMDWLHSMPPEQQAQAWEEFWRRRDPTPETPRNEAEIEFFRRLRYAEHHFQGFGPGWRSDMGRIYIKFGPPDQIESRPASSTEPQLEIWYYNQPYRRIVFADREGFGRFLLQTPGLE
ncbi:MAG: GWxTD domain-containing protein [Candidatus Eisenbacteria bacterium]|uniref:GWxTD domain-containing protein n=1 Tax=Eiseniibacteriota bacterium TaxID=2212470 RepID=A0A9D6L7A9_UNCEI|nr:GWxTD domain-containing protein [Candidatus Eisenbacteria bacterium]MBI3538920.1 GWxTD domain-containing protein [Candidatus Eisenbacteria bacterium]